MAPQWEGFDLPTRRKLGVWIAGILVLGLGIWTLKTQVLGQHLTECGVDANGPYARVRINSLVGGLSSTDQQVKVEFTYDGAWYDVGFRTATVPVLGTTTTVVHGTYPPRVINLHRDGGPKGKLTVAGHQVVHRSDVPPYKLVSESFVAQHPHHPIVEEMVPDALQQIDCSLSPPGDA